jgi:hypothetical protein
MTPEKKVVIRKFDCDEIGDVGMEKVVAATSVAVIVGEPIEERLDMAEVVEAWCCHEIKEGWHLAARLCCAKGISGMSVLRF